SLRGKDLTEQLVEGAKKSKTYDNYKSWANGFFGRKKAQILKKRLDKTWRTVSGPIESEKASIDDVANEAGNKLALIRIKKTEKAQIEETGEIVEITESVSAEQALSEAKTQVDLLTKLKECLVG
ncbi:MAG: hypothetical protein ACH255_21120, partial [Candidatus Thiodiazotropha sp.]